MTIMDDSPGPSNKPLNAFVSFPSPYTQTLIIKALVALIPSLKLSLVPPDEDDPPELQWADYDLLSFTTPHSHPRTHLISSYIYRKALIRKHQLHKTIEEYLVKCRYRGRRSVLEDATPRGWVAELQFADELDEMLVDELGELREEMEKNCVSEGVEKKWWILKPGFADRAQGIRLFSTEEELRAIFEGFEDDETESDLDEDGDGVEDEELDRLAAKIAETQIEEEATGTGVSTSQLRHFVIQEYIPDPILFDISQLAHQPLSSDAVGHKFHLRAYVLVTGSYTVHLSRTMLALFSGSPYTLPSSRQGQELDLRPHLTNTCLQTDAWGAPAPPEELVKLFWELEGLDALSYDSKYRSRGRITQSWLEDTFCQVGEVIGESVKAGAECGSFGLQLIPNAFEIFGVDLLMSFPHSDNGDLPIPRITLLEYNASPDFHQTGQRLQPLLGDMFKGVVKISVAPFFNLRIDDADEDQGAWTVGEEKWGWRLVGKGEIRGGP
ncbi:hypothetical protein TREMEDRAFT_42822 [Tremella mesenterica DSM 1558]|uniref:uncharacterized protein n=1 Tax=Tremella mesenterica (strain ATCC 24925 / CBS 8224 / DSM 1558 / NBRC 9311 / NRRL Y-6157 / RJB 2259-6 / UBC 559-6) TaxID=578456 RepID=UPI0003F49BDA|nr:uncharacterized protein TREMEDRAFT_42822 [Tremella mesenterica DSM 1558]EIW71443.1 hypothetical protein TREMEDRAFT_42822 [Tremella mesenterica DSM 1558]